MTNNDEGSKLEAMGEPLIELTAPDGTVMRFRFGAVIPLDGIEYAVLLEMEDNPDGEEQVLVTRIEPTDDGGIRSRRSSRSSAEIGRTSPRRLCMK